MFKFRPSRKQIILASLSFILPAFIFGLYFIFRGGRILTVDLGQQYIDFLAYFKTKFFTDPLSLIYNFNSGLGGSFLGTVGYYLTSPFNWLLFLLPLNLLPQAILLTITIKIGFLGLTSYYYWQKKFVNSDKIIALAASLAYALCSYSINFSLNLMWLDSLILLPLLIDAIDQLFAQRGKNYLVIITFLIWFTNFYTGFMTLFFGLGYYLVKLISQKNLALKQLLKNYFLSSILGSFLAAVTLVPTFIALLAGKTNAETNWDLNWQYNVWDIVTKCVTGAYDFNEMEQGGPNLYFALSLLLLSLTYFASKQFSWRKRLANFIYLIFLILSLTFNPLVLIWHLGQYPVWYPARFSFVVIFFLLNLAVQVLAKQNKLTIWQITIAALAGITLIASVLFKEKDYAFLSTEKIIISGILILCSLLLYFFISNKWAPLLLLALVGLETSINLITSLDSISYQVNENYSNFVSNTRQATKWIGQQDHSFYRLEKTFNHTENDPFSDNYYGVSLFDSLSNSKDIDLLNNLGLKNNDNSYSNQYSDLATDSILGIKYYLVPTLMRRHIARPERLEFNETYYRPDLYYSQAIKNFAQIQIRKNPYALPLFFLSPKTTAVKFTNSDPAHNQTVLLNAITGQQFNLFSDQEWPEPATQNVDTWPGSWREYNRINKKKASYLTFKFVPETNDPYYLSLTPDITSDVAKLSVDGHHIDTEELGTSAKLITLAYQAKGKVIKIKFKLHDSDISLNNCQILRFHERTFKQKLKPFLKKQPRIYQTNALKLTFKAKTKKEQTVNSTLPYSRNWLVFDNGHLVKTRHFANTFLSFKLNAGKHQLNLIYLPVELLIGLMITLIALIVFLKTDFDK